MRAQPGMSLAEVRRANSKQEDAMRKKLRTWSTTAACVAMFGTASGAGAAETSVTCTPTGVATFPSRVHIRCSQSFSGVAFFAFGSNDAAAASRNMSLATSALISGRNVRIFYDPADQSGASIGCNVNDCRLLRGLEIR